jgi:hypothetical protein
MHLLTIRLIISLFILQSYVNSGNSEDKISIARNFEKAANGIVSQHSTMDTVPPRPSPPPINRKWLFKANKLAADYKLNRLVADKKYKKGSLIVVEGIVKEIKEPGEHGITTIILDGGTSAIDVQCEVLNSFKIKNLKKGMKATLNAHCNGFNGNVILSGCIYLEKPTYE